MKKRPSFTLCIIMDLLGCATYLFPVAGEWFDVLWAPISAFVFYRLFSGNIGKIGSIVNLVEELLPFIDIIPTFTIGYFISGKEPKRISGTIPT